jgi:multimeric flavodoxin WrbA
MKKVLILVGSPRIQGNTSRIASRVEELLRANDISTEIVFLDKLQLGPCRGCGSCEDSGDCIQVDDMQELWEKVESSDGLVLASPTYYSGVTAQMKTFIDRTGRSKVIWDYEKNLPTGSRFSEGKRAMIISICGQQGEKWLRGPLTEMRWLLHDLEIPLYSIVKAHGADVKGGLFQKERNMESQIEEAVEKLTRGSKEILLSHEKKNV